MSRKIKIFIAIAAFFALLFFVSGKKDIAQTEEEIYKTASESVVMLNDPTQRGGGTGFQIETNAGNSYIITNNHVCKAATDQKQNFLLASNEYKQIALRPITIKYQWEDNDLCILEAIPTLRSLPMSSEGVNLLDKIYTVGHPLLYPLTIRSGHVLRQLDVKLAENMWFPEDRVVAESSCQGPSKSLESLDTFFFGEILVCYHIIPGYWTDAATYPGNSGSPVLNEYGKVVGVIFAGEGMAKTGMFIPLDALQYLLKHY